MLGCWYSQSPLSQLVGLAFSNMDFHSILSEADITAIEVFELIRNPAYASRQIIVRFTSDSDAETPNDGSQHSRLLFLHGTFLETLSD